MRRYFLMSVGSVAFYTVFMGQAQASCSTDATGAVLTCDSMSNAGSYLAVWTPTAFYNAEKLFKQAYDQWKFLAPSFDSFNSGAAIYNQSFGPGAESFVDQIARANGNYNYFGQISIGPAGRTTIPNGNFLVTDGSTPYGIAQALYKITLTVSSVVGSIANYSYDIRSSAQGYIQPDQSASIQFATLSGTGSFDLNNIQSPMAVPGPVAGAGVPALIAIIGGGLLYRRRRSVSV